MSNIKLRRPSNAWSVFTCISPRPVNPSSAKVETPMALSSLSHKSILAAMPPEPCWSTTTGRRPVPVAIRNCPVVTVAFPLASPVRNCASDNVMVLIACSSMRAAMSFETGSATAKGAATRDISSATIKPRRFINLLPVSIPTMATVSYLTSLDHLVGAQQERGRDRDPDCDCCFQVYRQLELGWLLDWQVRRLCAAQNLVDEGDDMPVNEQNPRSVAK